MLFRKKSYKCLISICEIYCIYFSGSGIRWQHAEHYDVAWSLIMVQISPIVLVSLIQIFD